MLVRIVELDWSLAPEILEGTVTFELNGKAYHAFSCLHEYPSSGLCDVEFDHIDGDLAWADVFNGNVDHRLELVPSGGLWSYQGFGRVVGVRPVIADFGGVRLKLGTLTDDESVVGEYILWDISRLDISPKG